MGIVGYGIGGCRYSEPDFPPDGNTRGWHETWRIRPEGFQDGHANVGDPFDKLLILWFSLRGVVLKILFDLLYQGLHLSGGDIDRRRHRVITLVHSKQQF